MRRRAAVVAGLATMTALTLVGCRSSDTGSSAEPIADVPADAPTSFALALGIDADDPDARAPLDGYDLVVVDGGETSAETVAALQDQGATVLAYLSVGTVEPGRDWFTEAQDEGWLLDHWDDWDEWYANVAEPGLRSLLLDEARSELDKGFDGLFLDNTDMVQAHPDQRDGMVQLVTDLDELLGADRLLYAQNGDPVEARIVDHLDGWNREDVSTTYDFDTESYAPVSAEDHDAALAQLEDVHDRGLVATATDYSDGSDPDADQEARDAACAVGALAFTSDIGLTRVASSPETCAS